MALFFRRNRVLPPDLAGIVSVPSDHPGPQPRTGQQLAGSVGPMPVPCSLDGAGQITRLPFLATIANPTRQPCSLANDGGFRPRPQTAPNGATLIVPTASAAPPASKSVVLSRRNRRQSTPDTKIPPLRRPGHRFFPAISDSDKIQIMPKKRKKACNCCGKSYKLPHYPSGIINQTGWRTPPERGHPGGIITSYLFAPPMDYESLRTISYTLAFRLPPAASLLPDADREDTTSQHAYSFVTGDRSRGHKRDRARRIHVDGPQRVPSGLSDHESARTPIYRGDRGGHAVFRTYRVFHRDSMSARHGRARASVFLKNYAPFGYFCRCLHRLVASNTDKAPICRDDVLLFGLDNSHRQLRIRLVPSFAWNSRCSDNWSTAGTGCIHVVGPACAT